VSSRRLILLILVEMESLLENRHVIAASADVPLALIMCLFCQPGKTVVHPSHAPLDATSWRHDMTIFGA